MSGMSRRHLVLALVLLATLGLAAYVSDMPDPASEAAAPVSARRPDPATAAAGNGNVPLALRLDGIRRADMAPEDANPFTPRSWYTPPPVAAAPSAPPAPPPMPFRYVGSMEGADGKRIYYLARGDDSFAVTVGETFAGSYRLDAMENDSLVIRYLPLSAKQTLFIGASS